MVVVSAICTQTTTKNMAPITSKVPKKLFRHSSNCRNFNIHMELFLSFGLINVNFAIRSSTLTSI